MSLTAPVGAGGARQPGSPEAGSTQAGSTKTDSANVTGGDAAGDRPGDDDTQAMAPVEDDAAADDPRTEPFTPIPPPEDGPKAGVPGPPPEPGRRWQGTLLGLFVLSLVVGLVMVFINEYNRIAGAGAGAQPSPGFAIAGARDFDPAGDGGDDVENPDLAALAVDGDPITAWTTERYGRSADFNGRKPGAGVIVDLGETRDVGRVTVTFGTGPTSAEIRVPVDAGVTSPPLESRDAWRVVETVAPSTGKVDLRLPDAVTTRFVLVYLTNLPPIGANYVGSIHEITVGP